MTRYTATIRHHSIYSARIVNVGNDLRAAKRRASKEFGDEYGSYTIIIMDSQAHDYGDGENIVASRQVSNRLWINY